MNDLFIKPEIGTVIDVNPASFSADVGLRDGRVLHGVALMGVYGAAFGQDLTWLHNLRGASVKLMEVGGELFIYQTLPAQQTEKMHDISVPVTEEGYGGSDEDTYVKGVHTDYATSRDTSFFAGDKAIRAETDTDLSLWREGIVRLRAGALAQIILGKFKDFFRLIARTAQIYTDFGEMKAEHSEEGRVGFTIKGGADFADETHPKSEAWTVRVWMGDHPDEPESRLYIQVNDKDGQEHVKLKYDIQGNHTLETTGDDTQKIGGSRDHSVEEDDTQKIGGSRDHSVEEDDTQKIGGSRDHSVEADDSQSIGGNRTMDIDGNEDHTVMGNQDKNVIGNRSKNVAGNENANIIGTWNITVAGPVNITSGAMIKLSAPTVSIN